MISICLKKIHKISILLIAVVVIQCAFPHFIFAQAKNQGLSLSVTPTLFEMSANPSQVWKSSVKVINNNRYDLTVYAQVVNFAPQGEQGEGKFLPVFEDVTGGATLAEWIDIPSSEVTITGEQSASIPFTVTVPPDASPGGHFAAILIGTRPPGGGNPFEVKTSQIVTSLFFVRIAGDVIENGEVREFTAKGTFSDTPKADFLVRFENKGNVHLQPQGEIVITNMWGKERGIIPINHQTHFGNVLPNSIRKFEFAWHGEHSFSDIGRYKAQLTLGYGDDGRKFVTRATYFWVIPIKAVSIVLVTLLSLLLFVSWAIKAYVRKMLALSGIDYASTRRPLVREGDVLIKKSVLIKKPVSAGMADLHKRLEQTKAFVDTCKTLAGFVWAYKIFFGSVLIFFIFFILVWYFFTDVTKSQRDYEIVIENPDADITLSSEEILYEKQKGPGALVEKISNTLEDEVLTQEPGVVQQQFELSIVNSSDTPGLAAHLQKRFEGLYEVTSLKSDFNKSKERTVIVYDSELQEEALVLSRELQGALLSALPVDLASEKKPSITIYIGNDYTIEE